MAIDWSTIEGYNESMSAEEKLTLIEKQETKPTSEQKDEKAETHHAATKKEETTSNPKLGDKTIPKSQFDAVSSELARVKKELRAKQSEDERKASELEETRAKEQEELKALRKEKELMGYKASFLGLGYDEQLATETADALSDNDMDAVFAAMKKQNDNLEKNLRAKILKETPTPPAGDNSNIDEDPFIAGFKKG
jgi:hypothetical protein